jgi:hypothetical protein
MSLLTSKQPRQIIKRLSKTVWRTTFPDDANLNYMDERVYKNTVQRFYHFKNGFILRRCFRKQIALVEYIPWD